MKKRFESMSKIHGLIVFHANLDNFLSGNKVFNFIKRLESKDKILNAIDNLGAFIVENKIKTLFFSTAEGYASHNLIYHINKRFPKVELIALQHGLFPLGFSRSKESLRRLVNGLFKKCFGVFPFGVGFGGLLLDIYMVYSERERKFLVEKRGWPREKVKVSLEFVKSDVFLELKKRKLTQNEGNAIFLMQCLSSSGLCSPEKEMFYNQSIINTLSKQYTSLYLKGHPACSFLENKIDLPDNVIIIDNMYDGFEKCKTAISFFSTALFDAKIFSLKTVGIFIEALNVDPRIYETFDITISFEDAVIT